MPSGRAKAVAVLAVSALLACSCQAKPKRLPPQKAPAVELAAGRVGAAFEQWLYKGSMLRAATSLAEGIGSSTVLWRHTGASLTRDRLLEAAPSWIAFDCKSAELTRALLPAVGDAAPALRACGFKGVWLSSLAEENEIWLGEKRPPKDYAPASFDIRREAGKDAQFKGFMEALEANGLQSGTELLPAATGLGADFMLEARGASSHKGLYALWPVPKEHWGALPKASSPWDCKPLPPEAQRLLEAQEAIPARLSQDGRAEARGQRGWGVTGEVLCTDGQTRRYAYRWAFSLWRPVLHWQHPGARAKILLAGSAMQTVGVRRQTLAGSSLGGLDGLESAPAGATESMHPASEALCDVAANVSRCGGWSLLLDSLHPSQLDSALSKASFVRSPSMRTLLEGAFKGDAAPLRLHIQELVDRGTPFKGLAHGLAGPGSKAPPLFKGMQLSKQEEQSALHATLSFEASLPGLFFLSTEDLARLAQAPAAPGAFLSGLPSKGAYANEQTKGLFGLLSLRASMPVARGRLLCVQAPSNTSIAVANGLEDGSILVSAVNFSAKPQTFSVRLPGGGTGEGPRTLYPARPGACRAQGGALVLSLLGREGAQVLVPARSKAQRSPAPADGGTKTPATQ